MAKFSTLTVDTWSANADSWLRAHASHLTRDSILTGRDAWTVASRAGITADAYTDRSVTDGHIQTALQRIFPNAVFLDAKAY